MIPDSTRAAWAVLGAADPDSMCRDETAELLDASKRVRAWLDSVELRAARRLRHLAEAGRAEPADSMLTNAAGHTGRGANDVTARDKLCTEQPQLEDALAAGDLTAKHLDAINAAAKGLPDEVRSDYLGHSDALAKRAEVLTPEQFARECRELAKHLLATSRYGLNDAEELEAQRAASKVTRWVDKSSGMHHTRLELDPVRDAKLNATMNRALARLRAEDGNARTPWSQLQVDAFVAAVTGERRDGGATRDGGPTRNGGATRNGEATRDGGATGDADTASGDPSGSGSCDVSCRGRGVDRVPEVTVVIDWQSLTGEAHAAGICETENGVPLPVSTVRRLCCDAEIIPVVLDGDGRVLDQGRSRRTANREQRRALRAMHRTCAHPDCTVGFDACRIHHITWWRHGGRTDIVNLLPLCERHHHLVHEGGWGLTMAPDRTATWLRPDGTHHHTGTTIDRRWIGRGPLGGRVRETEEHETSQPTLI